MIPSFNVFIPKLIFSAKASFADSSCSRQLCRMAFFLSEMFGRFHSPQTNCSSRSKQATFTSSSEQRIGALEEKTVSLRHGEAFFFFFFCPSWHRNGLVGRKRESGGKTNDEKVYSIPVPSLNTWKERERHIWIQSASL